MIISVSTKHRFSSADEKELLDKLDQILAPRSGIQPGTATAKTRLQATPCFADLSEPTQVHPLSESARDSVCRYGVKFTDLLRDIDQLVSGLPKTNNRSKEPLAGSFTKRATALGIGS